MRSCQVTFVAMHDTRGSMLTSMQHEFLCAHVGTDGMSIHAACLGKAMLRHLHLQMSTFIAL